MKTPPHSLADANIPVLLNMQQSGVLLIADGEAVTPLLEGLCGAVPAARIHLLVVGDKREEPGPGNLAGVKFYQGDFSTDLVEGQRLVVFASRDAGLLEEVKPALRHSGALLHVVGDELNSDFSFTKTDSMDHSTGKGGRTDQPALPAVVGEKLGEEKRWKRITSRFIIAFALMITGHLLISALPLPTFGELAEMVRPYFDYRFLAFVLAGFLAQMIDGMLSMGYGVTSATCLMSFGVNPVSISAAIHTSEIFTSGISGYSHYRFGNVNRKLFRHLVIPGVIGAVLGALLLVFLGERAGNWLMPLVALYAMFLGIRILVRAFQPAVSRKVKRVGWLAWIGGFFDSFGGGGWGPIVTSTLIAKGRSPKYTVGSVSLTEFFVTLASAATFFVTIGVQHLNIVLGLLIGGVLAAPLSARLAGRLPRKTMMIAVGIMVIAWCLRMIARSLF